MKGFLPLRVPWVIFLSFYGGLFVLLFFFFSLSLFLPVSSLFGPSVSFHFILLLLRAFLLMQQGRDDALIVCCLFRSVRFIMPASSGRCEWMQRLQVDVRSAAPPVRRQSGKKASWSQWRRWIKTRVFLQCFSMTWWRQLLSFILRKTLELKPIKLTFRAAAIVPLAFILNTMAPIKNFYFFFKDICQISIKSGAKRVCLLVTIYPAAAVRP